MAHLVNDPLFSLYLDGRVEMIVTVVSSLSELIYTRPATSFVSIDAAQHLVGVILIRSQNISNDNSGILELVAVTSSSDSAIVWWSSISIIKLGRCCGWIVWVTGEVADTCVYVKLRHKGNEFRMIDDSAVWFIIWLWYKGKKKDVVGCRDDLLEMCHSWVTQRNIVVLWVTNMPLWGGHKLFLATLF